MECFCHLNLPRLGLEKGYNPSAADAESAQSRPDVSLILTRSLDFEVLEWEFQSFDRSQSPGVGVGVGSPVVCSKSR